jgi:hypothetical protein
MRDPTKVIAFGERALDCGRGELRHRERAVAIQPTPLRVPLDLAEEGNRTLPLVELEGLWAGLGGDEAPGALR